MKSFLYRISVGLFALSALTLTGCKNNNQSDHVISERYIHKYGYALTKAEWEAKNYPGQVITSLDDGVSITRTYEGGLLHGPTTVTYPHSQVLEQYTLYNQGEKVKQVSYDPTGMPKKERVQLSPNRYSISMWYHEGSPMSVEEYAGKELLDGQYFSLTNEVETRVEKGAGLRIRRTPEGTLVSKELIEQGYVVKKETFYPNGTPETIAFYYRNQLHGEKRAFASNGEPLSIEEWVGGKLHGKSTYFKNGNRYLEISYLYGQKNGIERHYIDGDILSQEISWENDLKHGPSYTYIDGQEQIQWFHTGQGISKHRFEELARLDEIADDQPRSSRKR